MKNKTTARSRWFLLAGMVFTFLQMLFDTLNVSNLSPDTHAYIGFCSMFLVLVSSGFKQFFDPKINNNTILIQVGLFVVYVAGGVLDQFNVLPFTEEVKGILRIGLTMLTNFIPIMIKTITQED